MGRFKSPFGGCFCCCCAIIIAGIGCLIAGGVYYAKYDPSARQNEINAYSVAMYSWTSFINSGSQQWASYGGFNVTVDTMVSAPVTTAAIEPYAIEQGSDIMLYTDRAAYTTTGSGSPFLASTRNYPGSGNQNVNVVVKRPNGQVIFTRTVTMEMERTEAASTSCRGSGSSRTCTTSCSRGRRSGSTCYMNLYATTAGGGICFVVDPATLAYVGGCAIMADDAASILDSDAVPNKVGDVSYAFSEYSVSPWPDVPVVLRSSKDPWVVVATQSRGYMTFGAVSDRYKTKGQTLLGVGGGLLALPVLLLVGFCGIAFWDKLSDCSLPAPQRRSFSHYASTRFGAMESRINANGRASLRRISKSVRFGGGGGGKVPVARYPPGGSGEDDPSNSSATGMELAPKTNTSGVAPFRAAVVDGGGGGGMHAHATAPPVGDEEDPKAFGATGTGNGAAAATTTYVVALPPGTDTLVLQPAQQQHAPAASTAPPPYNPYPHSLAL